MMESTCHWYVLDLERRDEGSWWGAEMGAELADMNYTELKRET